MRHNGPTYGVTGPSDLAMIISSAILQGVPTVMESLSFALIFGGALDRSFKSRPYDKYLGMQHHPR